MPIASCHNGRIGRNKLLAIEAFHGRDASKRPWLHVFKLQIMAATNGIPTEYYIHAGSEVDITGLRTLAPDLREAKVLCSDAGHTD